MLYQEVRPKKLDEVVGNSATIGSLRNIIRKESESRPHAILLKGPSGCGKTTIARILAKEFGSDETSTFEYNAANTRGIDTVRDIASKAHFKGLGNTVKTYIIDESHELTKQAQQCFLKVIEDNPPHCYFIFCTTDPDRLIGTVRNRCSEYQLRKLAENEVVKVLKQACKRAGYNTDSEILEAISITCEGSPRAALVSLEQVAKEEDVDRAFEVVVKGTKKDSNVIDLCKLLLMNPQQRRKKWKKIVGVFDTLDEDNERIRRSILTFLFNKLKKMDSEEDAKDIAHLLRIFSTSVYYGNKAQLGSLVVRACFETRED